MVTILRSNKMAPAAPSCTSWAGVFVALVLLAGQTLAAATPVAVTATRTVSTSVPAVAATMRINPDAIYEDWALSEEAELRRLRKRQGSNASNSSPVSESATRTISIGGGRATSSSSASPLPSLLDGSLSSNFTSGPNGEPPTCPSFINSLLTSPTFQSCYPLSVFLKVGSQSFFEAQQSLVSITRTLDKTCEANAESCNAYLRELANNITLPENCGTDYQRENPTVINLHTAMLAYAPLYTAGCLRDLDTSAYCYANAVTNHTNAAQAYFYHLPLNMSLPGSATFACTNCLQRTMAVFQVATADRKQYIVNTYASAAHSVNIFCGPTFANETLAPAINGAGRVAGLQPLAMWLLMGLPFLAALL